VIFEIICKQDERYWEEEIVTPTVSLGDTQSSKSHFLWPHGLAVQWVRLPAWGLLLVFCRNQLQFLSYGTDKRTDGRVELAYCLCYVWGTQNDGLSARQLFITINVNRMWQLAASDETMMRLLSNAIITDTCVRTGES